MARPSTVKKIFNSLRIGCKTISYSCAAVDKMSTERAVDVTVFGSFHNSTSRRVLDLLELELGSMRLGKVVIKRVSVVKLGVNNGSGDGGGCFGSKI